MDTQRPVGNNTRLLRTTPDELQRAHQHADVYPETDWRVFPEVTGSKAGNGIRQFTTTSTQQQTMKQTVSKPSEAPQALANRRQN